MFLLTCDSCWFCFPLPPLSLSKWAECCLYSLLPHSILSLAFIPASAEGRVGLTLMLGAWDVLLAKAGAVLAGCKGFFYVCEGAPCCTCIHSSLAWGLQFGFARVFCTA